MARWWPTTYVEAKASGLKFYRSARPCRRGHMAERYVSTKQCTECHKERAVDVEQERVRKRELMRRRRLNPAVREQEKEQRQVVREQRQKYEREWRSKNRLLVAGYAARRRVRKKAVFVEDVPLEYLMERDGGRCQLCGHKLKLSTRHPHPRFPTRDHIVPLTKGGKHERSNMQLVCFVCNSSKGNRSKGEQLLLVG